MPEIGNFKTFGHLIFGGRPQCTLITAINMSLIIEIRHDILIYNVMGIILRCKNLKYMLEIDI